MEQTVDSRQPAAQASFDGGRRGEYTHQTLLKCEGDDLGSMPGDSCGILVALNDCRRSINCLTIAGLDEA